MNNFSERVRLIRSVANLLRGPYRPNQYKDVMLPMTALRRLDCVLEPTREKVQEKLKSLESSKVKNPDLFLFRATGVPFYNTSKYTFEKLKGDPNHIAANVTNYIKGFSTRAREIIEHFGFEEHIAKLEKADRLYLLVSKFCEIDLHPDKVPNIEMGYIFEELIRGYNEDANEEAGDHFTPREVIRLMVDLLFLPDEEILAKRGAVRSLYDPACGTGGMLSISEEYLRQLNPDARLEVFGQDYNPQAYAICGSDMMLTGHDIENVRFGDSFTADYFAGRKFDYMLANPPFGVEWKPQQQVVEREREEQGFGGRFGAGLPRINDGSFLFLLHMISKMKDPKEGGTRLAIVFNGSPLFTGGAGSGESEIRRWIIENDWLEGIVALPEQLFYNTGILTYLWIVTNRKDKRRRGKVQIVDATSFFKKMRKSLGNKRNEICEPQREEVVRLYGEFKAGEHVRVFDNEEFGYRRVTVERPLRRNFCVNENRLARVRASGPFQGLAESRKRKDAKGAQAEVQLGRKTQEAILSALSSLQPIGTLKNCETFSGRVCKALDHAGVSPSAPLMKAIIEALGERDDSADVCVDKDGNPEPDPDLRDYENVRLKEEAAAYMAREVLPHVSDAWVDESKTRVGYEINVNRYFYKYIPPRPPEAIEADLKQIEREIADLLGEVTR